MKKMLIVGIVALVSPVYADLGIVDTVSELAAKTGASNLGILNVYDHPGDVSNGQFYVPVQYNRTNAEGNGTEHDANFSGRSDIDYINLSDLKGAQGVAGASGSNGSDGSNGVNGSNGATGSQGAQGNKGDKGDKGNKGDKGDTGKNGANGTSANADNQLHLNVGAEVRWYDWKHFALSSGYRYDVRHYNHTVDMAIIQIKIGSSYEEREIQKLKKMLGVK